jgi:hypothetical protein
MVGFLFALPSLKKRQQLEQGMISKHNQIANGFQIEIKASFSLLGFSMSSSTVSQYLNMQIENQKKKSVGENRLDNYF